MIDLGGRLPRYWFCLPISFPDHCPVYFESLVRQFNARRLEADPHAQNGFKARVPCLASYVIKECFPESD